MSYAMEWNYGEVMAANPHFKQEDIDELRRWVQSEEAPSNVPKDLSESMLLCFHNACNWIISDTKKCVKTYFNVREKAPELFDDRDMTSDALVDWSKNIQFSVFPVRTDDGQLILHHSLSNSNADLFHFTPTLKIMFMTVDRCIIEHGPVVGVTFIFDMKNVRLGHLTKCQIATLAKTFTYIQEATPVKISKIIILNTVSFFNKILVLVKPFMKKELYSVLSLYPTDLDYETFYRDVLPKKCLPAKYGGELQEIGALDSGNRERLVALKGTFAEEERQRHLYGNKGGRAAQTSETFRRLNID